jgi:hypothetical protein
MRWTIPGLNTRETALLVWLAIFALFMATKPDVRRSVASVFKTLLGSVFLTVMIASAAAWATGAVLLLRWLGDWQLAMAKVAVAWFIGSALIAVFYTDSVDSHYFRRLVVRNVAIAAIVEFVVNLHTFPLPIELVFVPLAALLVLVQAYAATDPAQYAAVSKVVAVALGLLGAASLAYSITYFVAHSSQVLAADKVEEFTLPVALTLLFVPYLVVLRFAVVYQTMLHMVRFGLRENAALYPFARRAIVRACGPSLGRAQLFEKRFCGQLWGATSEAEVEQVISAFEAAWASHRSNAAQA